MEPAAPDDRIWITYTRERAFPISAVTSAAVHAALLALVLLGVISLFGRREAEPLELEPIAIADMPGGGAKGEDVGTRAGIPLAPADAVAALDDNQRLPAARIAEQTFPEIKPDPDGQPVSAATPVELRDPLEARIRRLAPVESLGPLLRGLPDARPAASGGIGRGAGQGAGTGPGAGSGDGSAGRLTQKQRRQLRWTLLFNIRSAPDYLDQLDRLKAIIGVQYPDKSIKLVSDLRRRPSRLEAAARIPDRIFWVDENAEAVRSMADELAIDPPPWRVIAFFPPAVEEELLRKEKAFGKRFGRETEDDIGETVFRVEEHYGNIDITVVRQQGRK